MDNSKFTARTAMKAKYFTSNDFASTDSIVQIKINFLLDEEHKIVSKRLLNRAERRAQARTNRRRKHG